MIRILIVEDSKVVREVIKAILEEDKEFEIVGEAESGEEAVKLARERRPHVITMDVNLKGKDGLYATREIMAENPTPIVIMSTLFDPKNKETTFKAFEEGAVEVFEKPVGFNSPEFENYARRLRRELKILANVKVHRRVKTNRIHKVVNKKLLKTLTEDSKRGKTWKLAAIGSSTGGPQTLYEIFSRLHADLNFPIAVVQHIAPGFLTNLVEWLNSVSELEVVVAKAGEKLLPGKIYFAPDNFHLTIDSDLTVRLLDLPSRHSCKPSVSVFFESLAKNFRDDVIAIILTGMGRDGAEEIGDIKANGGLTIAQDEKTSTIFGMPNEAIVRGGISYVLSPKEIAELLNKSGRK